MLSSHFTVNARASGSHGGASANSSWPELRLRDQIKVPRRLNDRRVLLQLDARAKRVLARRLPWPYGGMVSDISSAIQTCSNYLAALGLACYTETCGRELLFQGSRSKKDWECFNEFVRYMGAGPALQRRVLYKGKTLFLKDAVRNGLAHEYFLKADSGTVAMISSSHEALQTGFVIQPSNRLVLLQLD